MVHQKILVFYFSVLIIVVKIENIWGPYESECDYQSDQVEKIWELEPKANARVAGLEFKNGFYELKSNCTFSPWDW